MYLMLTGSFLLERFALSFVALSILCPPLPLYPQDQNVASRQHSKSLRQKS